MRADNAPEYEGYLRDESRQTGYCSGFTMAGGSPEIAAVLRRGEPVTVQGARTGLTGGAVPLGGHVLNLSAFAGVTGMRRDADGFSLEVRPGTVLADLRERLARREFDDTGWDAGGRAALADFRKAPAHFFAPDPTEETATLGGMFATNAGGPSSLLYGRTADHLLAADIRLCGGGLLPIERGRFRFDTEGNCPLPDGRVLRVGYAGGSPVHTALLPAPGSDLLDLFAGSEGVLGVAEQLRLRLLPCPQSKWGVFFFLESARRAARFAQGLLEAARRWEGCSLSVLEYLDRHSLALFTETRRRQSRLAAIPPPPSGAEALLVELVGEEAAVEEALGEMLDRFNRAGGSEEMTWAADSEAEIRKFHMLRHSVPEAVNTVLDERRRENPELGMPSADVVLRGEPVSEYLPRIQSELDGGEVPYALYAHLGTGCLHIALLPRTGGEWAASGEWIGRITERAARGGFVAGEYGVGKRKRGALAAHLPEDQLALMRSIKRFFDPDGLLCPGNLL